MNSKFKNQLNDITIGTFELYDTLQFICDNIERIKDEKYITSILNTILKLIEFQKDSLSNLYDEIEFK